MRRFVVFHLPAIAWTALATWLLLLPGERLGSRAERIESLEELGHGGLIFGLAWLVARSWRHLVPGSRLVPWLGLTAAALYAVAFEGVQQWVPGRGWEMVDVISSVVGAALARLVPGGAWTLSRRRAPTLTSRPKVR